MQQVGGRLRWRVFGAFWAAGVLALAVPAQGAEPVAPDPAAALDRAVAAAEASLKEGRRTAAEAQYQSARAEGWTLAGVLSAFEGRMAEARDALDEALRARPDDPRALRSLALVHVGLGDPGRAVEILERLAARRPADLEIAFDLGRAYAAAGRAEAAAPIFARLARARPIPQTRVLIGRTWLDHREYARARAELRAALAKDPRVRRAHYFLGLAAVAERRRGGIEEALREFEAEVALAPEDPAASLELGVARVQLEQFAEALPALERATLADPPSARALAYLGRAQLGIDRPGEAAASLSRALEIARTSGANGPALLAIHLHLGQALQRLGRSGEAATHFAEAQRLSAAGTDAERDQLARYLADGGGGAGAAPTLPMLEAGALAVLSPAQREELRRHVAGALAGSYFNLGVLQLQASRFDAAADLLEKAAALDPDFPQVQSALGIASFNARRFDRATAPLARALAAGPGDTGLRRMLGLAALETGDFARAAEMLGGDPGRQADPALEFAYGLALVKSGRAAEAEPIFGRLLALHGDTPELNVLLGQAHAQQGDFDAAIAALQRALGRKADVAEANGTLGVIYLRQGRLPEAEQALRAELAAHPGDLRSQHNLALVLDAEERPDEALRVLRAILAAKPDAADARYLAGKILLAGGAAAEAVEHLEVAARLTPDDPMVHNQLGQAYQRLGRTELAQQQFDVFQKLKDKTR
jgi:tetratricopeptide (TPR) repeat protein